MEVRFSPRPVQWNTYQVRATSLVDVGAALNRRSEWGHYGGTMNCRPSAARITVSLRPTIDLPEWSGYNAAPSADQRIWDRMIGLLRRHEENHHAIFLGVINAFKTAIENETTPLTRSEISRCCSQLIRDHRAEQGAYDRRSAHGRNEGISLQP